MTSRPALVVDVKANSLDDGPGIRSVVFFKGCPLSCSWCHNPESLSAQAELSFDPLRCVGSRTCVPRCPEGALTFGALQVALARARCTRCFECVQACPAGVFSRLGEAFSAEALAARLLRDRPFFEHSGGGVTLSGGEPTWHMEFLAELLPLLTGAGVHTLLQTCGAFALEPFDALVYPHLRLIHFDLKLADPAEHRAHCGADPGPLRERFTVLHARALAGGVPVLPRLPLVPGLTATPANLEAQAAWLADLRVKAVQLLPYNPLWPEKVRKLGLTERLPAHPPRWMSAAEVAGCEDVFTRAGLQVVRSG